MKLHCPVAPRARHVHRYKHERRWLRRRLRQERRTQALGRLFEVLQALTAAYESGLSPLDRFPELHEICQEIAVQPANQARLAYWLREELTAWFPALMGPWRLDWLHLECSIAAESIYWTKQRHSG